MGSVALEQGLNPDTVWNHPENAELKRRRENPNVLMPGDKLIVPEKKSEPVSAGTESKHQFRLKDVPAKLKIQITQNRKPVANEDYELTLDGVSHSGTTDGEGRLEHAVPPNAKEGELKFANGDEYKLALGDLDPVGETTGLQKYLKNLGFYHGATDGKAEAVTEDAIRGFQMQQGLVETGKADDATLAALKRVYEA